MNAVSTLTQGLADPLQQNKLLFVTAKIEPGSQRLARPPLFNHSTRFYLYRIKTEYIRKCKPTSFYFMFYGGVNVRVVFKFPLKDLFLFSGPKLHFGFVSYIIYLIAEAEILEIVSKTSNYC